MYMYLTDGKPCPKSSLQTLPGLNIHLLLYCSTTVSGTEHRKVRAERAVLFYSVSLLLVLVLVLSGAR